MFPFAVAVTLAEATPAPLDEGVSEALARERAGSITDLGYELAFVVPPEVRMPVAGQAIVRLALRAPHRLVFDFAQPAERLQSVRVGGVLVDVECANGHIVVPESATVAGGNEVAFEFTAGDEPLNRADDFLYSLFVPARAHLVFPCFDQPDMKARFRLTLTVPAGWESVSNAVGRNRSATPDAVTTVFDETQPLPTYLFAFAAGRFSVETATRGEREMRMLHREGDAAKVARNREAAFDLHARALDSLERYTDIPYAFGKFDFVLIPSFQFSGMEHAGAIFYNAASILLDESATQNQLLGRASLIAHETSHMWFGDLVTMRWFNDVWMKEVFANLMAAKIVNPWFPDIDHDLRFFLSHYPAAYRVDRTEGTNPIRQPLGNLRDAGQMYSPIIYQKAPVVMRQLELAVGEAAFRDALQKYLRRHAFGNATWPDLVQVFDAASARNITSWSRAWVDERGRPRFDVRMRVDGKGRLSALVVTQRDPLGRGLVWPQELTVTLGYPGSVRHLPVSMTRRSETVRAANGWERPLYVLPAGRGIGYGLFVLDDASRDYLLAQIEHLPDALTRGSAWVTLWDNMLEGRVEPAAFLDAVARALPTESDEQNEQRVLTYMTRAFWRFLSAEGRGEHGPMLESMMRAAVERVRTQSRKAAWFNAYRDVVLSSEGTAWLERLWRRDERVEGLTFAEPDEIVMALELAVRETPRSEEILRLQQERTDNLDRRARLAFVAPALSANSFVRERAFERLRDPKARRHEPWVLESLHYLNHPLRAKHASRFVVPALQILREIQRTGDIFFPARWMDSVLWGHRSAEVASMVRQFLASRPDLPERLRWTILNSADDLFRAAR